MGETGKPKPPPSRRVGDETRKRIDDLASGWSLDADTEKVDKEDLPAAMPPPPPPPRAKPPSRPPPLPPPIPKAPPQKPRTVTPLLVREDATAADSDATVLQVDSPRSTRTTAGMRAREIQSVPRERGVLGDVQYVFRALFGVAQARRELADISRDLEREQHERRERLIAVARYVIGDESATWPSAEKAREALADVEEKRSRHAGAVAAADEEIGVLERERRAAHEAYVAKDAELETELKAIESKLAPLEKQATAARKKVVSLKTAAEALGKKISAEERKLVAVKGKDDPHAVEANLASLRAEREGVLADEPVLAGELDDLDPKIANLTAARDDTRKQRETAREREETEAKRTAEKITAVEARRSVEQSGVDDTDRERDEVLLALGEQIEIDRPASMTDKLRGADEHALAIATLERKQLELKELVEGVDRTAFARGVLWLVLATGLVIALVVFLLLR